MKITQHPHFKKGLLAAAVLLAVGVGAWIWITTTEEDDGFASGNGRIEATEIDVAAKSAGRVERILVKEGDFVREGDIVAYMDMKTVQAQLDEAKAELANARSAKQSASAQVAQRRADVAAARAALAQAKSERNVARKTNARLQALVDQGAVSRQDADESLARQENAEADVHTAEAQISAAEAAVEASQAQVEQAEANIAAAEAAIDRLEQELKDGVLHAPRSGRVQYRVVEPGEVVASGGKVVSLVDVGDVYMTFFLPEIAAGRTAIGSEVHIVLDAAPQFVIPARVSFVASVAQFTPKSVETEDERQKMMFRVKARIDQALLEKYPQQVKTGLPGVAHIRLDPAREWPEDLQVHLPGAPN